MMTIDQLYQCGNILKCLKTYRENIPRNKDNFFKRMIIVSKIYSPHFHHRMKQILLDSALYRRGCKTDLVDTMQMIVEQNHRNPLLP